MPIISKSLQKEYALKNRVGFSRKVVSDIRRVTKHMNYTASFRADKSAHPQYTINSH